MSSAGNLPHILIVGGGGHGRVVLDIVRQAGRFRPLGFLDADVDLAGSSIDGVKVLGPLNLLPRLLQQYPTLHAVIAIGDNRARRSCAAKVAAAGIQLANAIHPSAVVCGGVHMGVNVVIAAGAIVGVETQMGDSVILNTGAMVDHECRIGAGVHICPGAKLAGRVQIEAGAFIGLGAAIIQCRRVGAEAIVGAGAVVIHDIPAGATAVGVPARIIKTAAPGGEPSANMRSV